MRIHTIGNQTVLTIEVLLLITLIISAISIVLKIPFMGINDYYLFAFSLAGILFIYYLGNPYFWYSSEGEVFTFRNKGIFFKKKEISFPKYKLSHYKIKRGIRKKLELYIKSKHSEKGIIKVVMTISYLNRKQLKYLDASLERNIKEQENNNIRLI